MAALLAMAFQIALAMAHGMAMAAPASASADPASPETHLEQALSVLCSGHPNPLAGGRDDPSEPDATLPDCEHCRIADQARHCVLPSRLILLPLAPWSVHTALEPARETRPALARAVTPASPRAPPHLSA